MKTQLAVLGAVLVLGCSPVVSQSDGGADSGVATATAAINETGGAQGTMTFTEATDGVKVKVTLTAVPGDGNHGMHLHANGDCADNNSGPDGGSVHHGAAGGHFNPADAGHACPPATARHRGDMGNISIAGGSGTLEVTLPGATLSELVGKAVILHASPDDCMTQPTGNSGGRIGCGVITR